MTSKLSRDCLNSVSGFHGNTRRSARRAAEMLEVEITTKRVFLFHFSLRFRCFKVVNFKFRQGVYISLPRGIDFVSDEGYRRETRGVTDFGENPYQGV